VSNIDIAQAFFEAYTNHDIATMLSLCTLNATLYYVPFGENSRGTVKDVGVSTWQLYLDTFPDFKSEVKRIIHCDDTVVCEVVNSGTQAKAIGNIQNQGRSFVAPHLYILDFDHNQIKTITCYWDNDMIYAQLGHTEAH